MVRATAGARPAAAVRRSGKRAAQRADPRATEARKQGPSARSGGQARRPAAPGGKGRPARAAGCGLLAYASRGHPCHFPGVVGWLWWGKSPRSNKKGPALAGRVFLSGRSAAHPRRCFYSVARCRAVVKRFAPFFFSPPPLAGFVLGLPSEVRSRPGAGGGWGLFPLPPLAGSPLKKAP